MRTCIRSLPASARCAATCRAHAGSTPTSRSSRHTPPPTLTRRGSAATAGRWPTSPGASPTATTWIASWDRPVYLATATATRAGSTPGARACRRTADAGPVDGRIERGADGRRPQEGGRPHVRPFPAETPDDSSPTSTGTSPAPRSGYQLAGCQRHPFRRGRLHDLAGRGELTARVVGAMRWDHLRGRADRGARGRRARTAIGRYARPASSCSSMASSRTGPARSLDRTSRHGRPTGTAAWPDRPRGAQGHVTRLNALGFSRISTPSGAVREGLDAVEAARRANGPTDARHRPHQSSTRTTSGLSVSSASSPTPSRTGPSTSRRWTSSIHDSGRSGPAGSIRSRRSLRRRTPRRRSSWRAKSIRRPARPHGDGPVLWLPAHP